MKENSVFTVAITGSIGSGKSLAVSWFEKRGYRVISADRIGHEMLGESEIRSRLVDLFGDGMLKEGEIDRKSLGRIVFAEPEKLQRLNELLHPPIIRRIGEIIEKSEEGVMIFEIPLLFEAGTEDMFDLTINVHADEQIRRERIKERDQISDEEIDLRFGTQLSEDIKRKRADITVVNNFREDCLYHQLEIVAKHIIEKR